MATLLIPVGHDVGQVHAAAGLAAPSTHDVRFGDGTFSFNDDEYLVWRIAHGSVEYVTFDGPLTRAVIETAAAAENVAKPGPVVDELLSIGAIVTVDTEDTAAIQAFAQAHRTVPLRPGLGNTAQQPWLFATEGDDGERVLVSAAAYYLWMSNHTQGSLWQACEAVAAEARDADDADTPLETDPQALTDEFISYLPKLVAGNSLYVDRSI